MSATRRPMPPWRVACFLTAAAALNYGDRSAFSAILAPLGREWHLSDAKLGLLGALFLWSYAIGSPMAGNLSDRYSRSRVAIWSLILWSLFTALTGLVGGFLLLCACRIGLGVSESLYPPTSFALLADYYGAKKRGSVMAVLSIGSQMGVVAGGACAGYLGEHYGWRAGFWVLGAGGAFLVAVSPLFLADGPKRAPTAPKAKFSEASRYLFRSPSFHLVLAKQIFAESTTWTFYAWLPLYLYETFHLHLGAAGFGGTFMLQASLALGIGIGGVFSDHMVRRGGAGRRMLILGVCYLIATPFPAIFLGHPSVMGVGLAVAGCSLFRGLGSANDRPIICDIVPTYYRSTAYGIMNTCATASGAVGVLVAGLLKREYGLATAFAFSGVLFLLTGILLVYGAFAFMPRDLARLRAVEEVEAQPPSPDLPYGTEKTSADL